jgi:hypothetical protein
MPKQHDRLGGQVKIALFVDFDNVYSGLRRISAEAAERFSRQPLRWLHWLTRGVGDESVDDASSDRRRVLVRRCYLNPVMYQKYRRPFHEAGFEIVVPTNDGHRQDVNRHPPGTRHDGCIDG